MKIRRKQALGLNDPLRHSDHPRPVTRREFLGQGFVTGSIALAGASAFSLFADPRAAYASLAPDIDLLTKPPPGQKRLIGSDASHAWASVYCSGAAEADGQWLDFDPTNNRAPGEDYVTLATGRDFLDVSPLRGVIRGGSQHILDVAVTVTPIDIWPELAPGSH